MMGIWKERMRALTQRARMGWRTPHPLGNVAPRRQKGDPIGRRYRAERRNAQFGRKPRGNTTPLQRRVIWAIVAEHRAAKGRAA